MSEWESFYQTEPEQQVMEDYRFAQLCSIVTNIAKAVWGRKGSGNKMTSPMDFMPDWLGEEQSSVPGKAQSLEEMKSVLMAIAKYSGGQKKMSMRKTPPIRKK